MRISTLTVRLRIGNYLKYEPETRNKIQGQIRRNFPPTRCENVTPAETTQALGAPDFALQNQVYATLGTDACKVWGKDFLASCFIVTVVLYIDSYFRCNSPLLRDKESDSNYLIYKPSSSQYLST